MKKLSDTLLTFALCGIIFILIAFSPDAKQGALDGIQMCESIIIPSLLPVLIISGLLLRSRCAKVFEWLFGAVFEKLFALPRCSAAAVILGLTGGYPAGALLTAQLFDAGHIDSTTAHRLLRFNFCGGAAFIITAVGTVTYGSTKIGVVLFCINVLSALIIMLLTRFTTKAQPPAASNVPSLLSIADSLPLAVEQTVKSLAVMSAYIILFSALKGIVQPPQALTPLLEITGGICMAPQRVPLSYCAFFLSFGGLCIHFQLLGILRKVRMKYWNFLSARMLSALLSFALSKIYLLLFPDSVSVFSNLSAPRHEFSVGGISLSMVMIIGCAVVVFDVENRKLKLI